MVEMFNNLSTIRHNQSDIILHFTGNVFGIGCSAFNPEAIKRISTLKQRDDNKGYIVLFASIEQARQYKLPQLDDPRISSLLNQYLPGNLTAVLHTDDERFKDIWLDHKIAIRIPTSKLLRDFIQKIDTPIISTSVNISNDPPCNDLKTLHTKYATWFDYAIYDEKEKAEDPVQSTIIEFNKPLHNPLSKLKTIREGSIPFSEIETSYHNPLIQFVCLGNICRSPLAEFYARKRFAEENLPYRTASCGLLEHGYTISEHSQTILEKNGLSAKDRVSIPVNPSIIRQSMVLLCMAKDIKQRLLECYPEAKNKIYTFAEYITPNTSILTPDRSGDIIDPYGLDFKHYETTWKLVQKYTEKLIERLRDIQ